MCQSSRDVEGIRRKMCPSCFELKRQIGMLRYQRGMNQMGAPKQCCNSAALFRDSMIDKMLLPLYYAWTVLRYGSLSDIKCENYLMESYGQFADNAGAILQSLITMMENVRKQENEHQDLVMIDSLLITYRKIQKII